MTINLRAGLIAIPLLALSQSATSEDNSCDNVLELGFNVYKLYSESQINESYYLMLSKSEEELDKLADKYEKGESVEGEYKMISSTWSRNRHDEKYRERFRSSKFKYSAGLAIDNSFYEYMKTKSVNDETLSAWQKCRSGEILAKQSMKELELKSGGFIPEIVGDESGVFTFIINKIPQEGHPAKAKIVSVTKSNIEFIGDYALKANEVIENYTGISQSMRLVDPSEGATLVVNLDNYNPVSQKFNKNALSNFPLGSIIASVLDFNQFSFESKSNRDGEYNPSTSKWAPADGRNVSSSDYAKFNNYVPDLRGQFLRGVNIMYSTNEPTKYINGKDDDVRHMVQKYSYQDQATKLPNKAFTGTAEKAGQHKHKYKAIHSGGSPWGDTNNNDATQTIEDSPDTMSAGNHQHIVKITGGGDGETRPKNVAVYYYIRINK